MNAELTRLWNAMTTGEHPALKRTWWINLYPSGQCSGTLDTSKDCALNRCTYTGETPDAKQVEVRLVPVRPSEAK